MRTISPQAYQLLEFLQDVRAAEVKSAVLVNEKGIHTTTKNFIKGFNRKLNVILNDMKRFVSDRDMEMFNEAISEDTALQFENVRNMFFELNREDRDRVENFLEQLNSK